MCSTTRVSGVCCRKGNGTLGQQTNDKKQADVMSGKDELRQCPQPEGSAKPPSMELDGWTTQRQTK